MKFISKRGRPEVVESGVEVVEEVEETTIIITSTAAGMSDDDIQRAIEVFKELRRQLEGNIAIE